MGVIAHGGGGDLVGGTRAARGEHGIAQRDHVRGGGQAFSLPDSPTVYDRSTRTVLHRRSIRHDGVVLTSHGIGDQQLGTFGHGESATASMSERDGRLVAVDVRTVDHQQTVGAERGSVGGDGTRQGRDRRIRQAAIHDQAITGSDLDALEDTQSGGDAILGQAHALGVVAYHTGQPAGISGAQSQVRVLAHAHVAVDDDVSGRSSGRSSGSPHAFHSHIAGVRLPGRVDQQLAAGEVDVLGGQGGAADRVRLGADGQGLAGGAAHRDAVHNSHGTIGEGGVIIEGQRGKIGIIAALGHERAAVHGEGVRKGAGLRQLDGIALEGGSGIGIPLGGVDGHVALGGIKGGGGGQLVGLQGQGIRISAGVGIVHRQDIVSNDRALTGESTQSDVTAVRSTSRTTHFMGGQNTIGQNHTRDLHITRGIHAAAGDVQLVEGLCTALSRDVTRLEGRPSHVDGIGRVVSPNITDRELGSPRPNDVKGGVVTRAGIQGNSLHRARVVGIRKAQGHGRSVATTGGTAHTKAGNGAILIDDQIVAVLAAGQNQRALGIQFRVGARQLHSLEAAGDTGRVLCISHGNGRILQAVGGDAGDLVIADSTIGIGLHRFTKVSTTEVQQAITCVSFGGGKTLQSDKLLFGQLLAVQAVDFEGTTSIDLGLDLVECVLAQQLASVIKNDGLAQSNRTEVVDGDLCRSCVLILGNKLFVNGEAGRSRLSTHGERRALDPHFVSHHVTVLDSNGSIRAHMELFSRDSAPARNRKPIASGIWFLLLSRGRSAEETSVGAIRAPLP